MDSVISNKKFSNSFFARLGRLLKLELLCNGRRFLIAVLVAAGCIVFASEFNHFLIARYEGVIMFNHTASTMFCNSVFGILFAYTLQRRVNRPNPMAYPLIPVGTGVKFVAIFVLYIISYLLAYVTCQLAYTVEWLFNGFNVVSYGLFTSTVTTGYAFNNPFIMPVMPSDSIHIWPSGFAPWAVAQTLFFLSFMIFCCVRFKRFSVAAIVYVGVVLLQLMIMMSLTSYDFGMVMTSMMIALFLLSALVLVASYLTLKNKQI